MTPSNIKPKLQVGGTLNPRRHLYITRQDIEDKVYDFLIEGEYCNILSSRQVGKSSIVIKTALRLRENGVRSVYIDIAGELGTPDSAEQWYIGFLGKLARGLRINVNVKDWWDQQVEGTANQRFLRFFREKIALAVDAPIVIFVDEIDSTLKLAYTDDFFTAIRTMYNERSMVPEYERVTFCLAGVANPNELVKDARTTAYNVGRTIEVRDFEEGKDDLTLLEQALGEAVENPKEMVRAVLAVTGGHPFLTIRLCQEVIEQKLQSSQALAKVVADVFPSIEKVASDVHFQQIVRFWGTRVMEESKEQGKLAQEEKLAILTLYEDILKGKRVRDETAPRYIKLKLSGIVKRDDTGHLVVRNKIYEKIFDRRWVREQLPLSLWKRMPLWLKVLIGMFFVILWLLLILAQQTNKFVNEQRVLVDSLRTAQQETLREANESDSLRLVAQTSADSLRDQVAISESLSRLARTEAATSAFLRAVAEERADSLRDQVAISDSLITLATREIATGDSLRLSIIAAKESERIASERAISTLRADSLKRIVSGLTDEGDFEEARRHTKAMLALYKILGDRKAEAEALTTIGNLNQQLGSYKEDSYQKALGIYRDPEDSTDYQSDISKTLELIADAHLAQGDYSSALLYYNSLLTDSTIRKEKIPELLEKKGKVHFEMEEYEEGFSSYEEAANIYGSLEDKGKQASVLDIIERKYTSLGQPRKAYEYFNKDIDVRGTELFYISAETGVYVRSRGRLTGTTSITGAVSKVPRLEDDNFRLGLRAELEGKPLNPRLRFGLRVTHYFASFGRYCCFRIGVEGLVGPAPGSGKSPLLLPGVDLLYERDPLSAGARYGIIYGGLRATFFTNDTSNSAEPSSVPALGLFIGLKSRVYR